jgi:uncharacterized membrane protein/glutaredoxin
MRKTLLLLFTFILALNIPSHGKANPGQSEQPVVHVILFYSNGCPYCNQVLTSTMPDLEHKYHSQLNILLINVATLDDIDSLYSLGAALGLSKEQVQVPFLLVDHTTLVGSDEINAHLSSLVDQYLADGGIDLPDMPQLASMLTKGVDFNSIDLVAELDSQTATTPSSSGLSLAQGVLAIMVIAIILAAILIARSFQGKALNPLKSWLDIAIPILCLIGMGVSIYLTYIEISHAQALCGPIGDCNSVQSSSYAKLFGFFPIGLLGALGFMAIFITWLLHRYRVVPFSQVTGPALFGMAMFGTLFSVYLTYLEIFVIHAACIWCLTSAIVITALMLLTLPHITQWLAISDDEE